MLVACKYIIVSDQISFNILAAGVITDQCAPVRNNN